MARTPPGSPPTPEKSKVVGKVGVALPPVEPGVMEDAEAGKGYIGYYDGGAFGIPVTSKNKEAALLFLQYIGQDSVQGRLGGRRRRASPTPRPTTIRR